ncbi:hypothetical protein ACIQNU_03950 [Streptomyces sp. NPDC091292]|uniref:hypothetical protein n=1 Tax=Streptomyces sp. NPDC091292 TaxID=3365991 RepID=UPI003806B835
MTAPTSPRLLDAALLDAALADAREQLASAQTTSIHDHVALIRSHTALKSSLDRILWTLDAENDEPDVAAQVDAEDGVTRPAYRRYRRDEAVA